MGFIKKISSFREEDDHELKVNTPPSNFGDDFDESIKPPSPPPKKFSMK